MPSLVVCEMTLCSEAHITVSEVAPERLLAIVNTHVGEQVALLAESFLAALHLTNEWSLPSLYLLTIKLLFKF